VLILVLLGFLVGILSSLSGLGGGFMVVPFLIYLGKKAQMAVGTSFLAVMLIAVSALIGHGRAGNVDWKTGLLLAVGGVLGAQLGPLLLEQVPEVVFKRAFALLLLGTGTWLLWSARNAG